MGEEQVGRVTNFYGKIGVAAIEVTTGVIRTGDALHFKGHTTDFRDTVASMEMENQSVDEARSGDEVGIKVKKRVRENDRVYKVPKYPERTREHEAGDRAVEVFRYHTPRRWAKNESKTDYGWDILVTIGHDSQVNEDFYVQLKGSDHPKYVNNREEISIDLKVKTVNWLLEKPMPTMLCVCDTGDKPEKAFYVWLQEKTRQIENEKPDWRDQTTLSFRVPVSNVLDEKSHAGIEEYVKKFHEGLRRDAALGNLLSGALGFEQSTSLSPFTYRSRAALSEKVAPLVEEAGFAEVSGVEEPTIEPLGQEDRTRFAEIKKASIALDSLYDDEAEKILRKLEPEIEKASTGIKARFFNNMGVLALRQREFDRAQGFFKKACDLKPLEGKYEANCLFAEYLLALPDDGQRSIRLSPVWYERVEALIEKKPEFYGAVRLKALWLSSEKGAAKSEQYLRGTNWWKDRPTTARKELAETYADEGAWDRSISLLKEVEKLGEGLDATYWGLRGNVLMHKAFGHKDRASSSVIYGPGPSEIDFTVLREAEGCLIRSCDMFGKSGFPTISRSSVVNLAVVQRILGKMEEAKQFCHSFLRNRENDPEIAAALAGCYMVDDKRPLAAKYAKIAYEADPGNALAYRNYLICLYISEDPESLIELVREREKDGFSDREEESMSVALMSVALNDIGKEGDAAQQLAVMKEYPHMIEDATVAEAVIAQSNGVPKVDVADTYRKALARKPGSPLLVTQLIHLLNPLERDDAKEIVNCVDIIVKTRQLVPSEVYKLGTCYLTLEMPEDALRVFEAGEKRYPFHSRILYGQACAHSELGDDESVYKALKRFLELGKKDYSVLRNLAFAALETGRSEEAIQLFQRSLPKAEGDEGRGELHRQLWELKRKAEASPKEILRHIIGFGKAVGDDTAKEAQFLMMALLSPAPESEDEEIRSWNDEIRKRLAKFSREHPDYPAFRTLKIPSDLKEEDRGTQMLAQIAEIMLPHKLMAGAVRIMSRGGPFPLAFRAKFKLGATSVFDFWDRCTKAKTKADAIHIWYDFNGPLKRERDCLNNRDKVCVDLPALMTLAELNRLDLLLSNFKVVVLAAGTRRTIEQELFGLGGPHPLAQRIEEWRLRNRAQIRIRGVTRGEVSSRESPRHEKTTGGIYVRKHESLEELLGCGLGESLFLAKKWKMPLYSDEALIREDAVKTDNLQCFCTMALIGKLRREGSISIGEETTILCQMIRKNFRVVPFDKGHLNSCLFDILEEAERAGGTPVTKSVLMAHEDMGTLLRQFGDPFFNEEWLVGIAIEWCVSLLKKSNVDTELFSQCLEYPANAISLWDKSKVITGVKKYEQADRLGHVFGFLLLKCLEVESSLVSKAWSAIKTCAERIFCQDREKFELALFHSVPTWVVKELESMQITPDTKLIRWSMIDGYLPEEDRTHFYRVFRKLNPQFASLRSGKRSG